MDYFRTDGLAVGYRGRALIHDINIGIGQGKILTLIGPNGAGKSTILKTITRHLAGIAGSVVIGGRDIQGWSAREMASQVAVVLTDRIRPELMTCGEVVAMGRYPYTNALGKMTEADKKATRLALQRVHALDLADQDFSTLSDGQRQRILLARAICQEPRVMVLDEPTAYLDIRFKLELLEILRDMAQEEGTTVVMSLHEIDLAAKLSDYMVCVKGDTIAAFGTPEEILRDGVIEGLYGLEKGSYNRLYGSVEFGRPEGEPRVYVAAGGGYGTEVYRILQKYRIPFATGILPENDIDCPAASALSGHVVTSPAFEVMSEEQLRQAVEEAKRAGSVIDAGTPIGSTNRMSGRLLELAEEMGLPVYKDVSAWLEERESAHTD
ncbi:MAG: ABC transporter ATP-binding protein [Roseburia sp.]|nr:ABC transporter ATP-binding protein [Roseburia sp.]MCM1097848.1 ABC transporter ATP-binding protein [Ruminococcus flavefaciens]